MWNRCSPTRDGPIVAATDYIRAYPDQIRPFLTQRYVTLGTDGFGRSDLRAQLRKFFEVNRYYVAVAALKALADEGALDPAVVSRRHRQVPHRPGEAQPRERLSRLVNRF
jgi:pyruvate dehydrogenase E1 component